MSINPWIDPKTGQTPTYEWEDLPAKNGMAVSRLRVEGGWIYIIAKKIPLFVPGG